MSDPLRQAESVLWTVAHQDPLSVGFSRQEYWSGFPFLPSGDLPHPGIKSVSPICPTLQVDSLSLSHWGSPHLMHWWKRILFFFFLEANSWSVLYSGRWVHLGQSNLLDWDIIHYEALPQEKKLAFYSWGTGRLWFSLPTFTEVPLKSSAVTLLLRE